MKRTCPTCGSAFIVRSPKAQQVYCSPSCRPSYEVRKNHQTSTCSIGAINEMSVASHLLKHGYDVYRAISHGAPYDLVASSDGELWRIEVRTCYRRNDGRVSYKDPKCGQDRGVYDVLAMVVNGEIIFDPDPWGLSTTSRNASEYAVESTPAR